MAAQMPSPSKVESRESRAEAVATGGGTPRSVVRNVKINPSRTTNPWGMDYDQHGQIFVSNSVTPHLYHVIPGGHYERMYGQRKVLKGAGA